MKGKKIVYLFDIDGTIIGDISPQILEWELTKHFNKSRLKFYRANLLVQLATGLVRKHLSTFMKTLLEKHNGQCEFFIYTASDTKWAHYIVPCIETVIGQAFNRPLFTREHCQGGTQKSIAYVLPRINSALKTNLSIEDVVLIDNNKVLIETNIILCPTYNYIDYYDVLRLVSEKVLINNFLKLIPYLQQYKLFPKSFDNKINFNIFKTLYFESLAELLKANEKPVNDIYWKRLENRVMEIEYDTFKEEVVKYLNKS